MLRFSLFSLFTSKELTVSWGSTFMLLNPCQIISTCNSSQCWFKLCFFWFLVWQVIFFLFYPGYFGYSVTGLWIPFTLLFITRLSTCWLWHNGQVNGPLIPVNTTSLLHSPLLQVVCWKHSFPFNILSVKVGYILAPPHYLWEMMCLNWAPQPPGQGKPLDAVGWVEAELPAGPHWYQGRGSGMSSTPLSPYSASWMPNVSVKPKTPLTQTQPEPNWDLNPHVGTQTQPEPDWDLTTFFFFFN